MLADQFLDLIKHSLQTHALTEKENGVKKGLSAEGLRGLREVEATQARRLTQLGLHLLGGEYVDQPPYDPLFECRTRSTKRTACKELH